MKLLFFKIVILVPILVCVTVIAGAQTIGKTFLFEINASGIEENLSSDVFDINRYGIWDRKSNFMEQLAPRSEFLFSISNPGRDEWVDVYYLKFRGKLVLIDYFSEEIFVYPLNTTRARLVNGKNTLRVDVTTNQLWFNTTTGTKTIDNFKPEANDGEGVLLRIGGLAPTVRLNKLITGLIKQVGTYDIDNDNSDQSTPNFPTFGIISTDSNAKPKLGSLNAAIHIFPNPAQDKLTVQLAAGMEKATVTIVSALGTTVAVDNTTGLQRVINLFGKPSGTYLVRVTTKDGVSATQKLIIQ